MEEAIEEMSTLDKHLPRYYKGFDIDIIIKKVFDGQQLTQEEEDIITEVQDIYYKRYFDESHKRAEEWKKAHHGQYFTFVDPQRTDKR